MRLARADTSACALLRLSGSIRPADGPRLSEALTKAMVDSPTCLVCDMSEVTWLAPTCVAIWVAAQWSGPWPGPTVWLAGAHGQPAQALRATGAPRFLALADSADAALALQATGPPLRRERLTMAPVPGAPGRARRFTTEVLASWAVPELTEDATLIASELVTNGIQHAGSDLELRLEHSHDLLHIAVRDRGTPTGPPDDVAARPRAGAAPPEHGRGLAIVRALAVATGRTSAPGGGSVYWATLRTGGKARRPWPARTDPATGL